MNYKLYCIIVTLFFSNCNTLIKNKAQSVIENFDNSDVGLFDNVSYSKRGDWDIWKLNKNDSIPLTLFYLKTDTNETIRIDKHKLYYFSKEFPNNIPKIGLVRSKGWKLGYGLPIVRNLEGIINFTITTNMDTVILVENIPENEIFIERNPFKVLRELHKKKEKLKILTISSKFYGIEFYLSDDDILTYIEDISIIENDTLINENYKNRMTVR